MSWRCALGLLVLLQVSGLCSGSATLKLHLVSFRNSVEDLWDGSSCDFWGAGECDHRFKFCLDTASSGDQSYTCTYYSAQSGYFGDDNENDFGSDIKGVKNPITKSFSSWPSSGMKFKVEVQDDDSGHSSHDLVDRLAYLISASPDRSELVAPWQEKKISGLRTKATKTTLSFKFKLYCDRDYYGSTCTVFCQAKNSDAEGHYTCDPSTGAKRCMDGWEGSSCKTPSDDCVGSPCENGGVCVDGVRSYTCKCLEGYTGDQCQVAPTTTTKAPTPVTHPTTSTATPTTTTPAKTTTAPTTKLILPSTSTTKAATTSTAPTTTTPPKTTTAPTTKIILPSTTTTNAPTTSTAPTTTTPAKTTTAPTTKLILPSTSTAKAPTTSTAPTTTTPPKTTTAPTTKLILPSTTTTTAPTTTPTTTATGAPSTTSSTPITTTTTAPTTTPATTTALIPLNNAQAVQRPDTVCLSAGAYRGMANVDGWCRANCFNVPSFCPESHCQCFQIVRG